MGAKVDNTRSFIRYSRTETKNFICSEAGAKYDFFQATSDCLIKLSGTPSGGGSRYYQVFVNDETTQTALFNEWNGSFQPERGDRYALSSGGRAGTQDNCPYDLILLLQKGDTIKLSTNNAAGYTSTWKINIYE